MSILIQFISQVVLVNMKKNDVMLILIIFGINTIFLINSLSFDYPSYGNVYFNGDLVMQVDLSKDAVYSVEATMGQVEITVEDGKVAITKETSPLNICSKQGYVNVNVIPLVCLPNNLVVEGSDIEVDGVAR